MWSANDLGTLFILKGASMTRWYSGSFNYQTFWNRIKFLSVTHSRRAKGLDESKGYVLPFR